MSSARTTSLLQVAQAFWCMGRQEALSYPFAIVNRAVNLMAAVFLLFFASDLVPTASLGGMSFASFALFGLAALQLLGACLSVFPGQLRQMQVTGQFEACLMTLTPPWKLLLAMPSYALSAASLRALVLLILGTVMAGDALDPAGILPAMAFLGLGVACFVCLGLLSASITLVIKRGDPIARLVQLGSLLLAGTFVPRDALPPLLAEVGAWFPIGPMLDGMRGSLFGSAGQEEPLSALLRLVVLVGILVPMTIVALPRAVDRVQRDGSAGQF